MSEALIKAAKEVLETYDAACKQKYDELCWAELRDPPFEELRETIAITEAQQAQAGWQDIATAPKDFVTEFDGWNGERVPNVSWARPEGAAKGEYDWCVSEYISNWGYQNTRVRGLTHWRPLPAAPQQGSKTE